MERLHTTKAETASFTCPKCGARNRVLADEAGDHPCYKCGWHPDDDREFDGRLRSSIAQYVEACVESGLPPDAFAFSTIYLHDYGRVPGEVISEIIAKELANY